MSRFMSSKYQSLEPYTPGEQPRGKKQIKLNTNENPYSPSPQAAKALTASEVEDLKLYPDPAAARLVAAIARHYGVRQDQVMVGNGSDEILAFSFMAFQNDQAKIYFPSISYGFYPVYGSVFHADWNPIPLQEDLTIRPEDYENLDGTIILANPNAPTGIALSPEQIERILRANPNNLVIIDEAYVDFGAKSCVPFVEKYDNLLVIQTFSKSRSLAGSRVGFAVGNRELISDLNRIKFSFNPYNLNRLSILAATAAMEDEAYFEATRNKIIATRETLMEKMENLGFTVLPSKANFIFAKSNQLSGIEYFTRLRERNIIVRHFNKAPIADFVRITIGTDNQMRAFLAATKEILEENK